MKNQNSYSKVIAGTMTWGSWGKALSAAEMDALMHFCLENGISSFDHADIYGGYTNEADFGNALKNSSIKREDIQLITKCGIQYVTENRDNKVKHYQYDTDYIIFSAETSLKNLQTEYIDLFLLHRPSPLMHPEEVAKAIRHLRKDGKIRDFGVSNFTPSQIALIETETPVQGNQVEYSLTSHEVMFDGTLDDGMTHNRIMMAWSPLGSYFREKDKQKERIDKELKELKKKYEATAMELLLAWIMNHPCGIHPVVGTTTEDRLAQSVKASELQLETEDWFRLLIASQGHKVP